MAVSIDVCMRERERETETEGECDAEDSLLAALHPCFVSCHINQPISLMPSEKLISSVHQQCLAEVGMNTA